MQPSISDNEKLKLPSIQTEVSQDIEIDGMRGASINRWGTLKQVMPIYIATYIAFLALTYLATLFSLGNFSSQALPLKMLLHAWFRWDSGQFTSIATHGYNIGFSVLSSVGIVGGPMLFSLYGYLTFHDPLAFSHSQAAWNRQLAFPWLVFWEASGIIRLHPFLTFDSIHTVMDLSAALFTLVILVLSFIGPWKFSREHWSYAFYAVAIYLFVLLVPEMGRYPLSSLARFMLEIFPAFIVIAAMGQRRNFNMYCLALCLPLLAFMLIQWLTGGWIV